MSAGGFLKDILSLIFGGKLPDGSDGFSAGVSIPLGSGYSVEAERARNVLLLQAACDKARYNLAWQPGQPAPGDTHCNGNADEVAVAVADYYKLRGADGKPLMADQQIAVLAADPDWQATTDPARFAQHAERGGLGFATIVEHPHGHLCPGYPQAPEQSDAWGGAEPMVSNVGETIGVMKLSGAFLLRQKPMIIFYLYKPEQTA